MGLDSWVCVRDEDFPAYVDFKEDFSELEGGPAGPEFGDSVLYHWKDHWDLHLWMDNLYESKGGSASEFDSFNNAPVAVAGYDVEALEKAIESGNLPLGDTSPRHKESDREFIALARAALNVGRFLYYYGNW